MSIKFKIGHSAYTGCNSLKIATGYQNALNELLSRKVSMVEAHKALKKAQDGWLASAHVGISNCIEVSVINS